MISLETDLSTIRPDEFDRLQPQIDAVVAQLMNRTCVGKEFLGWMDLPLVIDSALVDRIRQTADRARDMATQVVSIGIGGSYLGGRAAIEFLEGAAEKKSAPQLCFLGHHLGTDAMAGCLSELEPEKLVAIVISKSGTTTEPGIAFRLVRDLMKTKLNRQNMAKRIIAITDAQRGALRTEADEQGYANFVIPDDVGGRFSVLTPVGLVPIAIAGFDIKALLAGAADMADFCRNNRDIAGNPVLTYAAARSILYQKGKQIEVLSSFEPAAFYITEWWKQLFGESEGKDGKGIFPAATTFTTDLHSLGQYIQDGSRKLYETFLRVEKSVHHITIPHDKANLDGMNYLAGKSLDEINTQAYRGTALAHLDGGVPNMTLNVPQRNEYELGQLFYFFEYAVAVSGLLLGVNPFDQPGVEDYKKNMFALLGKPGFGDRKTMLENRITDKTDRK